MSLILALVTSKLFALFGGGLFGFGARLIGFDKKVVATAKGLPRWVWIVLAIAAVLVAGYIIHRHQVHKFRTEVQLAQMAADNDHWKKKLAEAHADALAWKAKAEAQASVISQQERTRYENTVRRDAADADALSLHGPGAAANHCRSSDRPSPGAATGGRQQTAAIADVAGPQVPSGDWAVVPWSWLVQRAQEHDDVVSEALAWRSNDARQRASLNQLLSAPTKQ